ncbi:hypothetical protein [Amycolatopsis sp. NPDC051128]
MRRLAPAHTASTEISRKAEDEVRPIFRRYLDEGGNFVDTELPGASASL